LARVFVTEAIASGLPPHIAQVICGHADINTTMGYKAVFASSMVIARRSTATDPGGLTASAGLRWISSSRSASARTLRTMP
jgi:2-methylisocitrate lyase-like PEP mutase family enzyme